MSRKNIYTLNTLDATTGEITPTKWITKEVANTDVFIRTYVEDIGALAKCSGSEQSVVLCCLKYLDYNTNRLYIDSQRRKDISSCGGLAPNTVNTAFSRLVKKNIFIKESNCAYLLNPQLFFFGSDMAREKVFSLAIRYKILTSQEESNS